MNSSHSSGASRRRAFAGLLLGTLLLGGSSLPAYAQDQDESQGGIDLDTMATLNEPRRAWLEALAEEGRQRFGPFTTQDALVAVPLMPAYPMAGVMNEDIFTGVYADLDPAVGSELDWTCSSSYTYDGSGSSFTYIRSFAEQAIGVPVYAAQDGKVLFVVDEFPDTVQSGGLGANAIAIDHGYGRYCSYVHLKQDSATVVPGETVLAGQQIASVGTSGNAQWPNLQFATSDSGLNVEPFSSDPLGCNPNPSSFEVQPDFDPTVQVQDFYFSLVDPASVGGLPNVVPKTGHIALSDTKLYRSMLIDSLPANSTWKWELLRPDGTLANSKSGVHPNPELWTVHWHTWSSALPVTSGITGTWSVRHFINGQMVIEAPFEVIATADPLFNRAPEPLTVEIDADLPSAGAPILAHVVGPVVFDDLDYDVLSYHWVWKIDGVVVRDVTLASRSDRIPGPGSAGVLTVEVTASDGLASAPTASDSAWIAPEPYGCQSPEGSLVVLGGSPNMGGSVTLGVDNPFGTQAAGSLPFVILRLAPSATYPCGPPIFGMGMSGPDDPGSVLVDVLSPDLAIFAGAPWAGSGTPAPVVIPMPVLPGLAGLELYLQGIMFDPVAAMGVDIGLARAVKLTLID